VKKGASSISSSGRIEDDRARSRKTNSMALFLNTRRDFLASMAMVVSGSAIPPVTAVLRSTKLFAQEPKTFPMALAEPLRHNRPSEIAGDLARFREKGYTGIWIENDYVRWVDGADDPDQGFNGCWRLFNIFDFTFSSARDLYRSYLRELNSLCAKSDLEIWASFWVPLPNVEMLQYLREHRPGALGQARGDKEPITTLCTCQAGQGLTFLTQMFEQFLDQFPQVKGVKIATGDNGAAICDETCPNAHGTTQAQHAGNLFGAIDRTLHRPLRKGRLMLYPWYWGEGFTEQILAQLQGDYLVMTKMEQNSQQALEPGQAGDPIFDDSIVSERPGPDFEHWRKLVGAERIIDMVPVGSGPDDWFFNYPPYPGRLCRRFQQLRRLGVQRFLDYECGGHEAGSNEEAVAIFSKDPDVSEDELLTRVASRLYRNPGAQTAAVRGWKQFDRGFGKIPMGLGDTGNPQFSGRFGFAWPLCLATPLVADIFGDKDRWHEIFWFSPYNFFLPHTSPRIQVHFLRVLPDWEGSLEQLALADRLENTNASRREHVAVQAHVLGAKSVLNWCSGAALANEHPFPAGSWKVLLAEELELTKAFQALRAENPWVWANNCWHPEQTPLHQKQIGFRADDRDPFVAKLRILEAVLAS